MAVTAQLVPGYTFAEGEVITVDKLNLLGNPTSSLAGGLGSLSLADGSVTTSKLASPVLTADSNGWPKMADGYVTQALLADGAVGTDQLADGAVTLAKLSIGTLPPAVVGSASNLVARTSAASPLTSVTVTADQVVLQNAEAGAYLAQAVNVSAVITAPAGAGGLDLGPTSEGANTWYYIHLISDGVSALAAMLSASATAPTLPSGYTFWAMVGAVFNNVLSDFSPFWQAGREVYQPGVSVFSTPTAATTPKTLQALSLALFVPPNAKRVRGTIGNNTTQICVVSGDGLYTGAVWPNPQGNDGWPMTENPGAGSFEVPIVTSQVIYWGAAGTQLWTIFITGWSF
jgi:hypothetical protein